MSDETTVTFHESFEDAYDVPGHAIPALGVIDVYGVRRSGGADLSIVIATPLDSDEYSMNRLSRKLSGYLSHIQTVEFADEVGPVSPDTVSILVKIHEDSSQAAFDYLEASRETVRQSGATLVVERYSGG